MFPEEFPADITAELPTDCSQESLLRIFPQIWPKIPHESFLEISKTAGNNYPRRF